MSRPINKKYITRELFDVRPVGPDGQLDLEKIRNISPVVKIKPKRFIRSSGKKIGDVFYDIQKISKVDISKQIKKKVPEVYQIYVDGEFQPEVKIHPFIEGTSANQTNPEYKEEKNQYSQIHITEIKQEILSRDLVEEKFNTDYFRKFAPEEIKKKKAKRKKILPLEPVANIVNYSKLCSDWKLSFRSFATLGSAVFLIIISLNLIGKGLKVKEESLISSKTAYASLMSAKNNLSGKDYERARLDFNDAFNQFNDISNDINDLGSVLVESSRYIPVVSKLSSGAHLAAAGKNISLIGAKTTEVISIIEKIKNPLANDGSSVSFLDIFRKTNGNLTEIYALSKNLQDNLNKINTDDIPSQERDKFIALKSKLPQINGAMAGFIDNSNVFTDILGGNGPRKYLFLFQNNQEMRATGGFIGTYGVLDIFNGHINKFFIDGIFNPDGQLREKVIPPDPVQKISAAWSLHDSNWFPDFPVSAEKATWFYEKTGGPTVDGVITMTPTVLQKLLEVTGPIDLPEYGVTIDKDNFIEKTQYEVEVDYDKELNQPKKILADLAPKILDKIFNTKDVASAAKVMKILSDSLNEKHLLIYSKNYQIQKILSERGWSGEVLNTDKDYLSVINTNINGFKTDGVIDEEIEHQADISDDGTVTDTLIIRRYHKGGDTPYEWWNKVNADYMRVYVPKGSRLLEVSGQTREFNAPPLDYKALGFKSDPNVFMEENSMIIDEQSGTRIYEDAGKTVFANWTYVSPKETMEIKYKYVLPFKVDINSKAGSVNSYSVLFQKQSGSIGSKLTSSITFSNLHNAVWKYPEDKISDLASGQNGFRMEDVLSTDKFLGVAFARN